MVVCGVCGVWCVQEAMMGAVNESLEDADAVLLILDGQYPKIEQFEAYKNRIKCPLVVVMNKVDLVADQEKLQADIAKVQEYLGTEHVYAASALETFNMLGSWDTWDLGSSFPSA